MIEPHAGQSLVAHFAARVTTMTLGLVCGLGTVIGCSSAPVRYPSAPSELNAPRLEGTWYILVSNFPRWADKDRSDVTFTYRVLNAGESPVKLDDEVAYLEKGKRETIRGVDTQHAAVSTHFTWRGRGWLYLFTSDWDIAAMADDGSWAVIVFSSTLATPEGVDVVSRTPGMDEPKMHEILASVRADPRLAKKAKGLFHVSHGGVKAGYSLE